MTFEGNEMLSDILPSPVADCINVGVETDPYDPVTEPPMEAEDAV
jgi:hypothetical protein